jgi:AraC family transcriptional regulator of adaptative response / DNA-3-methyladenine glycosylase II
MKIDNETCYRALAARDVRFDGLFFVGVTTTKIYCRPICPARTPGRDRCRFFPNAALAEQSGFRPCLRCRPELAPGHAPMDAVGRTARLAAARIEAGALNDQGNLESLAGELGLSSRQLRRAIRQEFGVSPVALAQTRRLLLAKQLLTETRLRLIEVAHASGFASVRRFNALFRSHYALTPSRVRKAAGTAGSSESLTLALSYRPPLAWEAMLRFLAARGTTGVECAQGNSYLRTVRMGAHAGWIKVEPKAGRNLLLVEISTSLAPALPVLLPRLRSLFDLDARPEVITEHLSADRGMARRLRAVPGLRVPGCIDGFEMAVRAILGQRVSVPAATTLAGRLASRFGEPFATPHRGLDRLGPPAERLAKVEVESLVALGIAAPRARAICQLAQAVVDRLIRLEPGADPDVAIERLKTLPGIGDWTAHYIAMRALRWPDAFPASDLGLLRAAGLKTGPELLRAAESWRPWRAYAAFVLWNSLSSSSEPSVHEFDNLLPGAQQPSRQAPYDI